MKTNILRMHLLFTLVLILHFSWSQVPGLIPYRKGKLWGYCNPDKKIIIPVIYDRAFPFVNGRAMIETIKDVCQIIDTNGNVVQTLPYRLNDYVANTGWLRMSSKAHKTGLTAISGKVILPAKFDGIEVLGRDSFEVTLSGKKGVINSKEKVLVKFIPYDEMEMFDTFFPSNQCNDNPCFYRDYSEGMAVIGYKGAFGYTDSTKKIVIECKYKRAEDFLHGLGRVMFDHPGQKKIPPSKTKDGVMMVTGTLIDEGYVDRDGNEYWEE